MPSIQPKLHISESQNYLSIFYDTFMLGYSELDDLQWRTVRSLDARILEQGIFHNKEEAKAFILDILKEGTPSRE